MKILITEKQKKLLFESNFDWVKRRLSHEELAPYINEILNEETSPCQDFSDEFEFSESIIKRAMDDFLMEDEKIMDAIGEKYDEIYDFMVDHCKDLFGEELFDSYRDACGGYD